MGASEQDYEQLAIWPYWSAHPVIDPRTARQLPRTSLSTARPTNKNSPLNDLLIVQRARRPDRLAARTLIGDRSVNMIEPTPAR